MNRAARAGAGLWRSRPGPSIQAKPPGQTAGRNRRTSRGHGRERASKMAPIMAPLWRAGAQCAVFPVSGRLSARLPKKNERKRRFVLTPRRGPTYIPPTDGDAALRGALNSVFSSFSGRTPPERSTSVAQVENGSPFSASVAVMRCLTIESEERETWTADVLAAQALGLGRTRHLTVTYQVHQRERRETFSRVLGTRQEK